QDLLQRRNQRLAAFEAEALGAGVALVQETLEQLGRGQALEDGALAALGEFGLVARHLDARLNPLALLELLDVHVFDADMAAIGCLERAEKLLERRRGEAQRVVDEDRPAVI